MRKWLGIVLLAALMTAGCGGGSDQEIVDAVHAYHAAFDAKNLQAMTALCTKDMFWYTLNGKAVNRSQMGDFFTPMLARWQAINTKLSGMEIRRAGGLAVARYQSALSITSSGKVSTMQNLYTTVLVKEDGTWKIWQHQMTTN